MEHRLDITIDFKGKDRFKVRVMEPESGLYSESEYPFSPDEHPEFDKYIGEELYSWFSLWSETEEIDFESLDDEDDWDDDWEYEGEDDEE